MDDFNLTYDDYLAHYGVKGMKWGVQRSPERKKRSNDRKRARKDVAKAREIEKRAGYYSKEARDNRQKVSNNKKKSEDYKKAYDKRVTKLDRQESAKLSLGVAFAADMLINQGRGTTAVAKVGLQAAGTAYKLGLAVVNSNNNVDRSHTYINQDGSRIRRPRPNFA